MRYFSIFSSFLLVLHLLSRSFPRSCFAPSAPLPLAPWSRLLTRAETGDIICAPLVILLHFSLLSTEPKLFAPSDRRPPSPYCPSCPRYCPCCPPAPSSSSSSLPAFPSSPSASSAELPPAPSFRIFSAPEAF